MHNGTKVNGDNRQLSRDILAVAPRAKIAIFFVGIGVNGENEDSDSGDLASGDPGKILAASNTDIGIQLLIMKSMSFGRMKN